MGDKITHIGISLLVVMVAAASLQPWLNGSVNRRLFMKSDCTNS